MAYDEQKSQIHDVTKGDLAYPGLKPYCHGEPALQCAQEAATRHEERIAYRKAHPGSWNMPEENWQDHMRDHEYMDRAENLFFGHDGPRTFEPGDAFITDKEK